MYACEQDVEAESKIKFPEFKPLELSDRECFETFIDRYQPVSCEYNFANLYSWRENYQTLWTTYQNRILIYFQSDGYFAMPLGKPMNLQELVLLSMQMEQENLQAKFSFWTDSEIDAFTNFSDFFHIEQKREISEYIYKVDSLAELTGVKLHKKRNLISQFKRENPEYKVLPLNEALRNKAFDLTNRIYQTYKEPPVSLAHEYVAIQSSFKNYDTLDLDGLAVMVGETLAAFSVFSRLNANTFDIQFEKFDIHFKGAAQLINQETAKYLQEKCTLINREQDLGVKGLRQAKMSYEPSEIIDFHTLTFRSKK